LWPAAGSNESAWAGDAMSRSIRSIIVLWAVSCIAISCATQSVQVQTPSTAASKKSLALMGYTIQAGAFAKVENAARFTELLQQKGLDATYFKASDGLFKVRFGNYSTKEQARQKAQDLQKSGMIEEYYVVLPEDYAVARQKIIGGSYLRESIVKTAHDFIGVPYLWGGASAQAGFDCSGLTMTVYQLNGLNLPRQSSRQYETGDDVERKNLQKGDLVFFALKSRGKVSHVGLYIGDGKFIHAPSSGKNIRVDSLSSTYFSEKFIGGKKYL
jgi:cell wall-associated NlpC family hydrolase